MQRAQKANASVFGVQYHGECWTGNDITKAKSYGTALPQNCGGSLGGTWTQQVYYNPKAPVFQIPPKTDKYAYIGIYRINRNYPYTPIQINPVLLQDNTSFTNTIQQNLQPQSFTKARAKYIGLGYYTNQPNTLFYYSGSQLQEATQGSELISSNMIFNIDYNLFYII